ncbi:hypothetical protein QJS10_CPA01g02230 [Acorus calamus]|uniref:Uncharacterized protein n=1 Tax=Acorus calamus TaxID=4465 RepID=A0AAV9FNX4_ACOCL|nr:hypothetical protein QJS10_CPA01g02230 [Acorus calamus]
MAHFLAEAESCINVITRDDNDDEEEMEAYESLREVFKKGTRALPVAEGLALFDTLF